MFPFSILFDMNEVQLFLKRVQPNLKDPNKHMSIKILQTCRCNNNMWSCAIAQGGYLLSTEGVYPPGFNGALAIPQPQAATAVRSQSKHLQTEPGLQKNSTCPVYN